VKNSPQRTGDRGPSAAKAKRRKWSRRVPQVFQTIESCAADGLGKHKSILWRWWRLEARPSIIWILDHLTFLPLEFNY